LRFDALKGEEFGAVYGAKKWHCEQAVVYFLAGEQMKFSAVASKKIGKAVARNLAKRRLRALFGEFAPALACGAYIIVAKSAINGADFGALRRNLSWSFRKIGALG